MSHSTLTAYAEGIKGIQLSLRIEAEDIDISTEGLVSGIAKLIETIRGILGGAIDNLLDITEDIHDSIKRTLETLEKIKANLSKITDKGEDYYFESEWLMENVKLGKPSDLALLTELVISPDELSKYMLGMVGSISKGEGIDKAFASLLRDFKLTVKHTKNNLPEGLSNANIKDIKDSSSFEFVSRKMYMGSQSIGAIKTVDKKGKIKVTMVYFSNQYDVETKGYISNKDLKNYIDECKKVLTAMLSASKDASQYKKLRASMRKVIADTAGDSTSDTMTAIRSVLGMVKLIATTVPINLASTISYILSDLDTMIGDRFTVE